MTEIETPDEHENQEAVEPHPEPSREPFDSHMLPLDDEDDARFLDPADPRRIEIERKRGRPFRDEEDQT